MTRDSIHGLHRQTHEAGQAIVELALVLPLLLVLLMGVIDTGRLLFTYIALEDAAQEGAIYSAHNPAPPDEIEDRVTSSSDHQEVTGSTVTVTCVPGADSTITVSATYSVQPLTPVGRAILGNTMPISATFIATNFKKDGVC